MAFLSTRVLDFGLASLQAEADELHVCSAEPASFAAVSGVSLANVTPSISAPLAGFGTSRKVTVGAVVNGPVSGTGTATHWALVDSSNSRLLAAFSLSEGQALVTGNEFNLPAFDIALGGV